MKAKRILAVIISAVMLLMAAAPASLAATPAEDAHLSFKEDGSFRIINFADIQDNAALSCLTAAFMRKSVKEYKPDLIVLTGDNISGQELRSSSVLAMRAVMNVLQPLGVPVAVVFGNHDAQHYKPDKEGLMEVINSYSVSVSYDEGPDIYGCGTYNVPIWSASDPDKLAYNIWMIDSNMYDEVNGGYDYVHEDQIAWYTAKAEELREANGGESVPALAFQHIIVPEIYDALDEVPEGTEGAIAARGTYYALPDTAAEGSILGEAPCPGTVNGGEFAAMKEQGDVRAIIVGHDHVNDFVIPYEGIDLINTPTCGFSSYGDPASRGARVIDLSEDGSYTTFTYLFTDLYAKNPIILFLAKVVDFFKNLT